MLYSPVHCNVNAVYPFLNLFKALETFTSKRLVKFVEILSFLKNLLGKNDFLAEENFPQAKRQRTLSARIKFVKSKESLRKYYLHLEMQYFVYFYIFFLCAVVVLHDANLAKWAGYKSTWGTGPTAHLSVQGGTIYKKPDHAIKHKQFHKYD